MTRVFVPPIKCQGIKTKLVAWILADIRLSERSRWIEPFMGSGVVGFNLRPKQALFADKNPHLINFYRSIQSGAVTPAKAKAFLEAEGEVLRREGEVHYKKVRDRFNEMGDPYDFLFLNRACFNGMIRFNSRGAFNTPWGHKPGRFTAAYVTKIANQIDYVSKAMRTCAWEFVCADFRDVIPLAQATDVLYCDPPYIGRHVDYFDSWSETDERDLAALLSATKARFVLSTWHSNKFRRNDSLERYWTGFRVRTHEHFYHLGAKEKNRNPMLEALVTNFLGTAAVDTERRCVNVEQLVLLEQKSSSSAGGVPCA